MNLQDSNNYLWRSAEGRVCRFERRKNYFMECRRCVKRGCEYCGRAVGKQGGFVWYFDGTKISGTGSSQTIKARDYAPGTHILSVIVTKNSAFYSKSAVFKITE